MRRARWGSESSARSRRCRSVQTEGTRVLDTGTAGRGQGTPGLQREKPLDTGGVRCRQRVRRSPRRRSAVTPRRRSRFRAERGSVREVSSVVFGAALRASENGVRAKRSRGCASLRLANQRQRTSSTAGDHVTGSTPHRVRNHRPCSADADALDARAFRNAVRAPLAENRARLSAFAWKDLWTRGERAVCRGRVDRRVAGVR
jgi:hypothetical protein